MRISSSVRGGAIDFRAGAGGFGAVSTTDGAGVGDVTAVPEDCCPRTLSPGTTTKHQVSNRT
jgi:hypothetical protein